MVRMSLGLFHLHVRKHIKKPVPFPATSRFARIMDYVMYAVALIAPLVLFPQVYLIYSTHEVQGLFLPTWSISAVFNILWITYAIAHRATPIILTNILFFALNAAAAFGIFLYS